MGKISAIVAARMTSSRLPGKVMMDLNGAPALVRLIERLKRSKLLHQIVIATTVNKEDDIIAETAIKEGVLCYRGSEEDVLLRIVEAAEVSETEYIVHLTGDCPLLHSGMIDEVTKYMLEHPYLDLVSNDLFPTYPVGFCVEIFRTQLLRKIETITNDPSDREHVSLYIYERPRKYHISNLEAPVYVRQPGYRLTLDTLDDYHLIKKTFDALYPINNDFDLYDIIKYLQNNVELLQINKNIQQKKARP